VKYLFLLLVGLYLAVALVVSEACLLRYVIRCEMNRFVAMVLHPQA